MQKRATLVLALVAIIVLVVIYLVWTRWWRPRAAILRLATSTADGKTVVQLALATAPKEAWVGRPMQISGTGTALDGLVLTVASVVVAAKTLTAEPAAIANPPAVGTGGRVTIRAR